MNSEYRGTLWLMHTGINAVTEYYTVSLHNQAVVEHTRLFTKARSSAPQEVNSYNKGEA